MAFRGLEEFAARRRAEWWSHISEPIKVLCERPARITLPEYNELRMNSWERLEVLKRLDDEALLHVARQCLSNCQPDRRSPAVVYDDSFLTEIGPLLINRLSELSVLTNQEHAS
jgi:hypothetical protein